MLMLQPFGSDVLSLTEYMTNINLKMEEMKCTAKQIKYECQGKQADCKNYFVLQITFKKNGIQLLCGGNCKFYSKHFMKPKDTFRNVNVFYLPDSAKLQVADWKSNKTIIYE